MSDKELLELAAKAMGYETPPLRPGWGDTDDNWIDWNPLASDGDEARLESALNLWVSWYPAGVLVGAKVCGPDTGSGFLEYFDEHGGDKQAARRYAGVKAAASIGAATKGAVHE